MRSPYAGKISDKTINPVTIQLVIAGKIAEAVRKDVKEFRGAKWKKMKDKVARGLTPAKRSRGAESESRTIFGVCPTPKKHTAAKKLRKLELRSLHAVHFFFLSTTCRPNCMKQIHSAFDVGQTLKEFANNEPHKPRAKSALPPRAS